MPRRPSFAAPIVALLLAACGATSAASRPDARMPGLYRWFSRPSLDVVRMSPRAGGAIDLQRTPGDSLLAMHLRDGVGAGASAEPRATIRLAPAVVRRLAIDVDLLGLESLHRDSSRLARGVHLEDGSGELVLSIVRIAERGRGTWSRDSITLEARAPGRPLLLSLTRDELDGLGALLRSYAAWYAVAPTAPGEGGRPYYMFEVDRQVEPLRGGCFPRYPANLLDAGITGQTVVSFVVEADGRANPETFRVRRATHPDFADAVRAALPCFRYAPARVGDQPVRHVVQQPFTFDIAR